MVKRRSRKYSKRRRVSKKRSSKRKVSKKRSSKRRVSKKRSSRRRVSKKNKRSRQRGGSATLPTLKTTLREYILRMESAKMGWDCSSLDSDVSVIINDLKKILTEDDIKKVQTTISTQLKKLDQLLRTPNVIGSPDCQKNLTDLQYEMRDITELIAKIIVENSKKYTNIITNTTT